MVVLLAESDCESVEPDGCEGDQEHDNVGNVRRSVSLSGAGTHHDRTDHQRADTRGRRQTGEWQPDPRDKTDDGTYLQRADGLPGAIAQAQAVADSEEDGSCLSFPAPVPRSRGTSRAAIIAWATMRI